MSIFSELRDILLEPRMTESKVHYGTVNKKTGTYNDYQTPPMRDYRARDLADRLNSDADRKIRRGEMRESERPEIWIETKKKEY